MGGDAWEPANYGSGINHGTEASGFVCEKWLHALVSKYEHDEFVLMLNSIKPVMWFEAFPYYVSVVT